MNIMNARVVIWRTGWISRKIFKKQWYVALQFAVEVERFDTRSSMEDTWGAARFKSLQSALLHAEELKKRVDGGVREEYYL